MAVYTSIAAVRLLEGMLDTDAFPDDAVTAAIDEAEELIDEHTGTSFVYKAFTVTVDGNNSDAVALCRDDGRRIPYPRTVASATINGDAVADVSGWVGLPHGVVWADNAVFAAKRPGRNVVVTGTAGKTATAPAAIARVAGAWARQLLLDAINRVDGRALTLTNDYGLVRLDRATARFPTGINAIDSVINRHRELGVTVG